MDRPRSILIVKLGAVGDCIHTLVAAHVMRLTWPEITLGWLVEGKSKEVVLGCPDLNRVHVWNRRQTSADLQAGRAGRAWAEVRRVIAEMRAERYEIAIDFQNLFKSGFFAWQSGARRRIGFERLREANFLFMNDWVRAPRDGHMVERYLDLLKPLGLSQGVRRRFRFLCRTTKNKPLMLFSPRMFRRERRWRRSIRPPACRARFGPRAIIRKQPIASRANADCCR